MSVTQSDILDFILANHYKPGDKLPTIQAIGTALDISVAKARESLEVARVMGVVEVKPGRGTRVAPYRFAPVATMSALYAIGQGEASFKHLRETRKALEIQFWNEAVTLLTADDIELLHKLVTCAEEKLGFAPIHVPAAEHRAFHLTIYKHLDNPFVYGIFEAFWNAYEAHGMNLYRDLDYHRTVWQYHSRMVGALENGQFDEGRRLLVEHMNLLTFRPGENGTTHGHLMAAE